MMPASLASSLKCARCVRRREGTRFFRKFGGHASRTPCSGAMSTMLAGHESSPSILLLKVIDFNQQANRSQGSGLPHKATPGIRLESGRCRPASDLAGEQRRAEQTLAARSSRVPAGDSRARNVA